MQNSLIPMRGLVVAAALAYLLSPASAQEKTVTFASFGGELNDALMKAWFGPVAEKLGYGVRADTMNGIADIRLQVGSGNVTWDVVNPGGNDCVQGAKEGLYEPLDYEVINEGGAVEGITPDLRREHWIGDQYYSLVLAYDSEKFADDPPDSWTDFWDTEKYPGRRGLYWRAPYTFEAALLADGVPKNELYPLDVARALRKLDELKPHIATYWKSGGQTIQLMKDDEVDLIMTWNGRAQAMVEDGMEVGYTFNEGILDHSCFAVPKGAKNAAAVMEMLHLIGSPGFMADLPKYITYGPANVEAYETGEISDERQEVLPSSPQNIHRQVPIDHAFWVENIEDIQSEWELFKTQ